MSLVTASEADTAQISNLEVPQGLPNCSFPIGRHGGGAMGTSSLERDIVEGENPVHDPGAFPTRVVLLMSRVVWDCSLKWVVDLIQS